MSRDPGNLRALEAVPVEAEGILDVRPVPDAELDADWDSIFVPERQKKGILAMAALAAVVRPRVDRAKVPLHGLILLAGAPGTGKTTLARGLASRLARTLSSAGKWRFVEVEPHALASAGLGGSQKKVRRLLQETIAEYAAGGPVVLLLDEIETLAADRYKLSLEANPIDVHRATDAVLASLDDLARRFPNLVVVATTNFPQAIDAALLSRADLIETIRPPEREGVERILRDTLEELAKTWPALAKIAGSHEFARAVDAGVGLDGRQLRKAVVAACAHDPSTALDPNRLTASALIAAIEHSRQGQDVEEKE